VVPALEKGENDFLALGVDPRRVRLRDLEARYPGTVGQVLLAGLLAPQRVTDKALSVRREVGVEGEPVDGLDLFRLREPVDRPNLRTQIEEEVRFGVRLIGERIQHAG